MKNARESGIKEVQNLTDLHESILIKEKKKNVKSQDKIHSSYAEKMQILDNQNNQTIEKLQKDFLRDMIENFKGLIQDLDLATGIETPNEVRGLQDEMFEKAKKDNT